MDVLLAIGTDLAKLVLALVFLWSGAVKMEDLNGFAAIAASYRLVPRQLAGIVQKITLAIPLTEVLAGGFILIGRLEQISLFYMAISLIGFIFLEAYELAVDDGRDNCGCYGTAIVVELSWGRVAKNFFLLGLVLLLLW